MGVSYTTLQVVWYCTVPHEYVIYSNKVAFPMGYVDPSTYPTQSCKPHMALLYMAGYQKFGTCSLCGIGQGILQTRKVAKVVEFFQHYKKHVSSYKIQQNLPLGIGGDCALGWGTLKDP